MDSTFIFWAMGSFFIFITVIFIVIAVFLPEWVGITGKKAQKNIREARGDHPQDGDAV